MSDPKAITGEEGTLASETQEIRNGRKLLMAVGDSNGMPDKRCVRRIARLIPKQIELGGEIPIAVLEFIAAHELEEPIKQAAAELEQSDGAIDKRRRAALEREREMRADQLDRKTGHASQQAKQGTENG